MKEDILEQLMIRYPKLSVCKKQILIAYHLWEETLQSGGKLLLCGNGGSEADALHIVGELMKEFNMKRTSEQEFSKHIDAMYPDDRLGEQLQQPLPAIALGTNPVFSTAYANDVAPDMIFAQEVLGYGKPEDLLVTLSTSGMSRNVINAVKVAKAMKIKCMGIGGRDGGTLKQLCDEYILIPETETYLIQELTLPVYHAICRMVEKRFA